jgi:hypothetical protein
MIGYKRAFPPGIYPFASQAGGGGEMSETRAVASLARLAEDRVSV